MVSSRLVSACNSCRVASKALLDTRICSIAFSNCSFTASRVPCLPGALSPAGHDSMVRFYLLVSLASTPNSFHSRVAVGSEREHRTPPASRPGGGVRTPQCLSAKNSERPLDLFCKRPCLRLEFRGLAGQPVRVVLHTPKHIVMFAMAQTRNPAVQLI